MKVPSRYRAEAQVEADFAWTNGLPEVVQAMFQPVRLGELELKNRVIVSPMDVYSAVDGLPGPFHLVHLRGKALGGAGLVMTEMVCVSPTGRITPGCTGLWTDAQCEAWSQVTDFVHSSTTARIGLQLGHSGRKGSTRLMWDGIDQPLEQDNWDVVGPSPLPYGPDCHVPREAIHADLESIIADFVAAARRGVEAGFDLVEVHAAHGYLLSSFLSPISNRRTDSYGGDLTGRLRFPLEVFDAVRAAVPAHVPVTVRISATDWAPDGNTEFDAVEIARAFIAHGAAAIDVSQRQDPAAAGPAARAGGAGRPRPVGPRAPLGLGVTGVRGTHRGRVEWMDTDAAGIYHTAVARYVESAEAALVRDLGLAGYFPTSPRVHYEVDFESPLRFGQEVSAHVDVVGLGASSMTLAFEVWGEAFDGRPWVRSAHGAT